MSKPDIFTLIRNGHFYFAFKNFTEFLYLFRYISDTLEEKFIADLVALWIPHRFSFKKPD